MRLPLLDGARLLWREMIGGTDLGPPEDGALQVHIEPHGATWLMPLGSTVGM